MSEYSAKTLREKMKAKARSLANPGDYYKDQEVSSADWSPAPPLKTEMKTGARPIMKPSSKGTGESYAARDTKKAIGADMKRGAFKAGGAVKKSGVSIPTPKETLSTKEIVGANPIRPMRGKAENYKKGGTVKKAGGGSMLEKMVGKPKGSDYSQVGKMGTANYTQEDKGALNRALKGDDALPEPAEAAERSGKYQNYKKGGSAKAKGGSTYGESSPLRLLKTIGEGKKTAKVYKNPSSGEYQVKHFLDGQHQKKADYFTDDKEDAHGTADSFTRDRDARKSGGRTRAKGKTNINIVIAAGRKAGPEAPPLDMSGGMPSAPASIPVPMPGAGAPPPAAMPMGGMPGQPNPGMKKGGRIGKFFGGAMNNRMVAPTTPALQMPAAGRPMLGGLQKAPAMPVGRPMMGGMQQPQTMPAGLAPRGGFNPMMARKAGGRISKVASSYKDMEAGSGSGEGRLQKTDIAKKHHDAPARKAGGKVYSSYKDMDAGAGSGPGRLEKTEIERKQRARGK